jgi:long-chain acyl-CoA synthetase
VSDAAQESSAGEDAAAATHSAISAERTAPRMREDSHAEASAAELPAAREPGASVGEPARRRYVYPRWPWSWPVRWTRALFVEIAVRGMVRLLARPRVVRSGELRADAPMLIVGNHVTTYDGPLLEYALPGRIRRRMAVAMSGEMLDDFRHWRNPETGGKGFYPLGPLFYFLITALFNVFPLPRQRDFHRSFEHAGAALDHGMNVMVFPEGTRSAEGKLARFRPGIGLLVKQADTLVLPMAIRGLGELKVRGRGWFRSGKIEVRVGQPIRFAPGETEAAITERLHAEVERLLGTP